MSSETQYLVEYSKSGRAACKKCKEKIGKGELRMITITHNGEYEMKAYHHPACFNLPRKYTTGPNQMTAEDFVRDVLKDGSDDGNILSDPEKVAELASAIAQKSARRKSSAGLAEDADATRPDGWMSMIKAAYQKQQDGEEPAAKKPKADDSAPVVTKAHVDAYEKIKGLKNDEMKEILRWNKQLLTGTKDFLQVKLIDGLVHGGRLARCQLCQGGKLKVVEESVHKVACLGTYDEERGIRIPCDFSSSVDDAPRWEPWYMEEPDEEADKAMEKLIEDAEAGLMPGATKAGSCDDPNVTVLVAAIQSEMGDDLNLTKVAGLRKAGLAIAKVFVAHPPASAVDGLKTVNLPRHDAEEGYREAKNKIGGILQTNRDKTIEELVPILVSEFGYVEDQQAKSAQSESQLAEMAGHPANAPVINALKELAELYFGEGNANAGATYKKAVAGLVTVDYEIKAENAMGLCKGKNKVAGIGKGTAEKIREFCSTGKIVKLEEKRMAAK